MEMQERLEKLKKLIFEEKREEFDKFRALLLEYNQKYNLTTILEEKEVFYKHFLDSAAGEHLFNKGAKVAEIGSGAGFPSIVLKILKVVVDNFAFQNVHIYNIRAEDGAKDKNFREKFDYVTARAGARMNSLSEYCLPFIKVGGKFIAYKSGDVTEITEAESAYKILGAKKEEVIEYELSENYGARSLAVITKIKPTPPKYPRGQGKERKQPL